MGGIVMAVNIGRGGYIMWHEQACSWCIEDRLMTHCSGPPLGSSS